MARQMCRGTQSRQIWVPPPATIGSECLFTISSLAAFPFESSRHQAALTSPSTTSNPLHYRRKASHTSVLTSFLTISGLRFCAVALTMPTFRSITTSLTSHVDMLEIPEYLANPAAGDLFLATQSSSASKNEAIVSGYVPAIPNSQFSMYPLVQLLHLGRV